MLSPDLLLLQLGYALLIAAVLAPRPAMVRALVALAAAAGLLRALLWTGDSVSAAWAGLLLATCLILTGRHLLERKDARFAPQERGMLDALIVGVPQNRARHLIDQGDWLTGKEGDVLTREGEPVGHLYYLAEGEAKAISQGREVGICRPGDLIGELAVLSGEAASATVVLSGPAQFWCASAEALKPYFATHDDIKRAVEQGFTAALGHKLRASNRTIAEAGAPLIHPG